ncbi:hypothetical protein LCGC14_1993560 [marine sediment metagenome]|uniref:Terminase large subunit gp17-like C-terminal domain-containing protein n=1 Tax=marine sediment metagenome TaxID=412755 RepID=A0A0F9HIQ4_9ZZZZ
MRADVKAQRAELELLDNICRFRSDPAGYIKFIMPWGEGELADNHGPRKWQEEILDAVRDHLRNDETHFQPLLISVASGKGIGKSALVGMISQWGMSTQTDCKIVLTANTEPQLRTKTWPEVNKWFNLALNNHWWNLEAESISIKDPNRKRLWRMDRIPWSENRPEAFAGLHNMGKRIIVIFDEASAIPDKIWEVTDGALTDEKTEILWFAFGNPTRNTGRFRECFKRLKLRWKNFQIDSRTVEGTNKEQIAREVEDYGGEEEDHVKIWVRGLFPSQSSKQFIPSALVTAARKYKALEYDKMPKILSVDVARFGDDQTVIGSRQGRKAKVLAKYHGLDTVQVAERVIEFIIQEEPRAVVVDGDGLGAGVVDQLKSRGYKCFEFHGAEKPMKPETYFNRRAEIWGLMRDWLKEGAEIPDLQELEDDLVGPEYLSSNKGAILLEKKADMKRRGLASPDLGDMLAMTFAVQIAIADKDRRPQQGAMQSELSWLRA